MFDPLHNIRFRHRFFDQVEAEHPMAQAARVCSLLPPLMAGFGSGSVAGYQIQRSVRLRSANSATLARTPGVAATSAQKFTLVVRTKRGKLGVASEIFDAYNGALTDAGFFALRFASDDSLLFGGGATIWRQSTAVFRDPSAFYEIVLAVDTTQATANNRMRLYVNGVEITAWGTNNAITQNATLPVNASAASQTFGERTGGLNDQFFDGLMADIHMVDGQQLTPSSFGATDGNGVWSPIAYTGTYGTNGYHLDFSDNSAATAAALGADRSGNSNNFTPSNISITAGVTNDSLTDTPTNYGSDTGAGGEVRGNYATFNPIENFNNTLSEGNLKCTGGASNYFNSVSSLGVTTGKWYWEFTIGQVEVSQGLAPGVGASTVDGFLFQTSGSGTIYGNFATGASTSASAAISSFAANDVIGIALDMGAGAMWIHKNGTWQNSATLAEVIAGTTTHAVQTGLAGLTLGPAVRNFSGGTPGIVTLNAGQRPFGFTAPTGFKALCTQNLTNTVVTVSGTFTGNAGTDGSFVYLNGVPTTMTINGNAVTFGTHADKLANGFKLRTASASYNASGSNSYAVSVNGAAFKFGRAQGNP